MSTTSALITSPQSSGTASSATDETGALVATDGTLDWFCVPGFDETPAFGASLDPVRGRFCRFGPKANSLGGQSYLLGDGGAGNGFGKLRRRREHRGNKLVEALTAIKEKRRALAMLFVDDLLHALGPPFLDLLHTRPDQVNMT